MLNHTDTLRDLMTVAHELGHGMHFALSSERQSALSMHAPLALCEVPSTFAELIVFERMLETEPDAATRTALIRQELESGFATVFRQTMMARYEQDAYGARMNGQALTKERLAEFCGEEVPCGFVGGVGVDDDTVPVEEDAEGWVRGHVRRSGD
jgi:oligoendopeptidase F